MLSPEIWCFPSPAASLDFNVGDISEDSGFCNKLINCHHFNHFVSIVLPDSLQVPSELNEILSEDTDYYSVQGIHAAEFVKKEFVESFVRRGCLVVLSDNTRIDVDDSICVTPTGELVLSLLRDTYLQLGLEGSPTKFCSGTPSRFIVKVDLKNPSFVPGNKNYERVHDCLQKHLEKTFNVLLAWEPPDCNICPSSVAAYVNNSGYKIMLCKPKYSKRLEYAVQMPDFPSCEAVKKDRSVVYELLEWLGAFSLGVDMNPKEPDDYINTYETPEPAMYIGQVALLQWTGLFSTLKIQLLYQKLRKYVSSFNKKPWVSLHVQGFMDSPVTWGLKEHSYFTDGDNHYTIFMTPSHFLACSVLSPSGKPRKKIHGLKKKNLFM